MFRRYDLHTHSTASDGTLSPAQLVERARAAGVEGLALTDHDTTDGLTEAAAAAHEAGLGWVPGIELSVTWNEGTLHVVGLGLKAERTALEAGLVELRRFRDWRAGEIGRCLAREGIPGAFEGARALSQGRLIGRLHFARYLVAQGLARDERQVFQHYLTPGKPGYVPGQWASLNDAVGWIRAAGGQAVLAHPARYALTHGRLRHLIGEFREIGGEALEVISGSHNPQDIDKMALLAREFRLLASIGSDFHGSHTPWLALGRLPTLPKGCEPLWQTWIKTGEPA
ncbi:MAG: PHP domain-containing protein [Pseudomonadota bacterium]